MASPIVMKSLWDHIQSLSLTPSNKKWLAEKLIESVNDESEREAILDKICGSWADNGISVRKLALIVNCKS